MGPSLLLWGWRGRLFRRRRGRRFFFLLGHGKAIDGGHGQGCDVGQGLDHQHGRPDIGVAIVTAFLPAHGKGGRP